MSSLRFTQVQPTGDDDALQDWRYIHNIVIPPGPLSAAEASERARRNYLEVALTG